MTKPDAKARSGTFAALRGILSDRVRVPPTNEALDQWIDEARSRTFDSDLAKRTGLNTQIVGNKDDTQD